MRRGQPDGFFEAQRCRLSAKISSSGKDMCYTQDEVLSSVEVLDFDETSPEMCMDAIAAHLHSLLTNSYRLNPSIDVDSPLMECGLDSYCLPDLVDELNGAYNVHLPAIFVFETGTIRMIAGRLLASQRGGTNTMRPKYQLDCDVHLTSAIRTQLLSALGRCASSFQPFTKFLAQGWLMIC